MFPQTIKRTSGSAYPERPAHKGYPGADKRKCEQQINSRRGTSCPELPLMTPGNARYTPLTGGRCPKKPCF
jgi:hypothetical protein